ncbi:MAG: DUF7822 domain-containing protein [Kofleriaceae bacterium]
MARISYLFTCDTNPDEQWSDNGVSMLSDTTGELPLSYLTMMCGSPRVTHSTLWEGCAAITCTTRDAVERTLALFERIAEGAVADRAAFEEALGPMRTVLSNPQLGPHLVLEVGDTSTDDGDDGDDSEEEAGAFPADSTELGELMDMLRDLESQVARALSGDEAAWIDQLRASWAEVVGAPMWSVPERGWQPTHAEIEKHLAQAQQQVEAAWGTRFRYLLAEDLRPHQLRQISGVLPFLSREVIDLGRGRISACEVGARPGDMKATLVGSTLWIEVGPGWPEPGGRRCIMDALGISLRARVESGSGTV